MFKTRLCDLLHIEYPILQGGMAWVATAELASAVSNAGGLGLIGAANMPHDVLRAEIRKTKAMTSKPFGVNIMLMSPFVKDVMQVVIDEKVPVVTTGAGNPGEYIPALKAIGTKVIPVVASVALAIRLERIGVDAIIAEGLESGGHVGEVTTMSLVPQVVDAVKIPVIAAGGIADARGVVAAFALGAKGVQIGTRFVASAECIAHANYKQAIIKAKDRSTVLTGLSTGHPVRVIENKLARDFLALERRGASVEEFGNLGAGKLRAATCEGDINNGSVMVGQISGLIQDVKTVHEIIQDIVRGIPRVLESVRVDLTNEQ
ncbi:MAG: enoyl-(acyl-carrier-protein) reductase [Anaerosporomusa subterranea]|nr:enoyl-(acyl-carrier-protein) reductase [Anaerosporomusa subterranea]